MQFDYLLQKNSHQGPEKAGNKNRHDSSAHFRSFCGVLHPCVCLALLRLPGNYDYYDYLVG